jgi:hypothetical protein
MISYPHRKKFIVFRYLNYTNDNLCLFPPTVSSNRQRFHKGKIIQDIVHLLESARLKTRR